MCSREGDRSGRASSGAKPPRDRPASLSRAALHVPLRVVLVVRPARLDKRTWSSSVLRLEELGVFLGQVVEKTGSPGQPGAAILKVGGSRVALSRELAGAVMVRVVRSHAGV